MLEPRLPSDYGYSISEPEPVSFYGMPSTRRKRLSLVGAVAIFLCSAACGLLRVSTPVRWTGETVAVLVTGLPFALLGLHWLWYVVFDITCRVRYRRGLDPVFVDTRTVFVDEFARFDPGEMHSRRGIYRAIYPLAIAFVLVSTLYILPGALNGTVRVERDGGCASVSLDGPCASEPSGRTAVEDATR